jgi:competence protein ComEA
MLTALAAGGRAQDQQEKAKDGDTKSQQTLVTVCSRCHPIERVISMRRTRSQWEEVMTTMVTARGAQVSDDEFETILNYLSKEYGAVLVNRAPAADLVEVLGISDTMAAAIVAYRREHGPFEDFEALVKVPGIDRGKLEQKRDAIIF